jgi:hypothetical protein
MGYPQLQQTATGHGTTSFAAVTFGSNSVKGNGIVVLVAVSGSSGNVTSISVTDNNGNSYVAAGAFFPTGKSHAYQLFTATNISVTTNPVALTAAATFASGSLTDWSVVAGEYNNVNTTSIVSAYAQGSNLLSQPTRTTAIRFDAGTAYTDNTSISGPPYWIWETSDSSASSSISSTLFDSPNFPGGTVSGGSALLVLTASNSLPTFVESNQGKIQLSATDLVNSAVGSGSLVLSIAPAMTAIQTNLLAINGTTSPSTAIYIQGKPTTGTFQRGVYVAVSPDYTAGSWITYDAQVSLGASPTTLTAIHHNTNDPGSPTSIFTLTAASTAVGSATTYTGTGIVPGLTAGGGFATVAGFVNAGNNGSFAITSPPSTSTSITLVNTGGVAETHAATLTAYTNKLQNFYSVYAVSPISANTLNAAVYVTGNESGNPNSVFAGPSQTFTLSAVSAPSGNFATYTGVNIPVGIQGGTVVITGFTNPANNGTFQLGSTVSGSTSFNVFNPAAIAETHAASAVFAANYGIYTPRAAYHYFGDNASVLAVGTPLSKYGSTITEYNGINTVSKGVPAEYAVSDLTAQTAAITATTIYAVPASGVGMYRVSWSAAITTAGTTSSLGGTNGFQVLYTSPTDSVVKTTVADTEDTSSANTTGTAVGGSKIVYAKASTNIQYTFDYSSTGTAMAYELHIKVEAL